MRETDLPNLAKGDYPLGPALRRALAEAVTYAEMYPGSVTPIHVLLQEATAAVGGLGT